jgi:hypothetical protein
MQYTFRVEVPPNTPPSAPLIRILELTAGEIRQIHILIPPGHCGLTGIRFRLREQVIIPASPDAWIQGDDVALTFPEKFELPDVPPRLNVEAYNEDTTYPHAFQVNITILPTELEVVEVLLQMAELLAQMRHPFTKTQAERLVKDIAEIKTEIINLRRVDMEQLIGLWLEVFGMATPSQGG